MNDPEIVKLLIRKDERITALEEENRKLREVLKNIHPRLLDVYIDLPVSAGDNIIQEVRSVLKDIIEILNQK